MKKNLKILVVEGNIVEENINFKKAGCISQSENFSQHVKMFYFKNYFFTKQI